MDCIASESQVYTMIEGPHQPNTVLVWGVLHLAFRIPNTLRRDGSSGQRCSVHTIPDGNLEGVVEDEMIVHCTHSCLHKYTHIYFALSRWHMMGLKRTVV